MSACALSRERNKKPSPQIGHTPATARDVELFGGRVPHIAVVVLEQVLEGAWPTSWSADEPSETPWPAPEGTSTVAAAFEETYRKTGETP